MYRKKMKTNKHNIFFTLALSLVLLTSCVSSKKYRSGDIIEITSFHHRLAVLPVESVDADIAADYQKKIYHALLSKKHKTVKIAVQKVSETNQILVENRISGEEVLRMDPKKLAGILGVDAVLKVKVEPQPLFDHYISDIAFAQISHDQNGRLEVYEKLPLAVFITAAIVDTETGELFWKYDMIKKVKANAFDLKNLEDTSIKIAKNFPYKWE